jgi:hypothetical protein
LDADVGVPVLDRKLAGDDYGSSFTAIFDDLDQVASLAVAQRRKQPVVDRQQRTGQATSCRTPVAAARFAHRAKMAAGAMLG